jgi:hypothetical protein
LEEMVEVERRQEEGRELGQKKEVCAEPEKRNCGPRSPGELQRAAKPKGKRVRSPINPRTAAPAM